MRFATLNRVRSKISNLYLIHLFIKSVYTCISAYLNLDDRSNTNNNEFVFLYKKNINLDLIKNILKEINGYSGHPKIIARRLFQIQFKKLWSHNNRAFFL